MKNKTDLLKPLKINIDNLKNRIIKIKEEEKFKDFDETMKKYYTHKLPKLDGDDLTILHNYWNNATDEDDMRRLFKYAEMDRYRTYNVAELLWESGCSKNWLEKRGVSEKTIEGLRFWYALQFPKYLNEKEFQSVSIKNFSDIPEDERESVQEYMKLFYNIICSSCTCDW